MDIGVKHRLSCSFGKHLTDWAPPPTPTCILLKEPNGVRGGTWMRTSQVTYISLSQSYMSYLTFLPLHPFGKASSPLKVLGWFLKPRTKICKESSVWSALSVLAMENLLFCYVLNKIHGIQSHKHKSIFCFEINFLERVWVHPPNPLLTAIQTGSHYNLQSLTNLGLRFVTHSSTTSRDRWLGGN